MTSDVSKTSSKLTSAPTLDTCLIFWNSITQYRRCCDRRGPRLCVFRPSVRLSVCLVRPSSQTSQECFEGFSSNFEQTSAQTHWRNSLDFGGQRSGDFPFHVYERSISALIHTHTCTQLWPFFNLFNGVAHFFSVSCALGIMTKYFLFRFQSSRKQVSADL